MNAAKDIQATRSVATNGIAVRLQRMVRRFFAPKPKRLELKLATYSEAEGLLRAGWTLAPEEDLNRAFGLVYLERLETPNDDSAAGGSITTGGMG